MKKRIQKLRLHRETLRTLTDPQLQAPRGAGTQDGCTENTCLLYQTGPCFPCMTNEFVTCEC